MANTYLDLLPNEIVDYIWSFNYVWGSNTIRRYWQKNIKNQVKDIDNMIYSAGHVSMLGYGVKNYCLHYKNRVLTNVDVFNIVSICKCCDRHQTDKPRQMNRWVETEFTDLFNNQCQCSCRHISRFICRQID